MIRNNITAKDEKLISVVEWADVSNPVGIVQIVHGMAEHALRYEMLAEKLNKIGLIVVADDHRAHGETDRDCHGYSDGNIWEKTEGDLIDITRYAKAKYSRQFGKDLDVVIFGHSYGSFLTQEYIKRHGDEVKGAVIGGSNYFKNFTVPLGVVVSYIAIMFGRKKKPNKFLEKASFDVYNKKFEDGTFISSIKEECERYEKDENCGFTCSSNFYYCFFKGVKKLYKGNFEKLKNFKILLVSGDHDPVGEMGKGVKKLEKFYKEKGADVKLVLYEGVRHEYLNDTSRDAVTKEMSEFFLEVLK